jgi:hypothetical protein
MNLEAIPTKELLQEIKRRGGHPAALAEAALLSILKAEDYSNGKGVDPAKINRSNYFPFGALSYAQMIHVKSQRFVTLAPKPAGEAVYEGLRDTALDIINYAGFYLASQDKAE